MSWFLQDFGSATSEEAEVINDAIRHMYMPDPRSGIAQRTVPLMDDDGARIFNINPLRNCNGDGEVWF